MTAQASPELCYRDAGIFALFEQFQRWREENSFARDPAHRGRIMQGFGEKLVLPDAIRVLMLQQMQGLQ